MKLPRDLSGERLAGVLCRCWAYTRVHQRGSHIVLETDSPAHQRISVPAHGALTVGTLGNIIRAVAAHKGITREELLKSILY